MKAGFSRDDVFGFLQKHKVNLLLFVVVFGMFVIGEAVSKGFASFSHIQDILRTSSFVGLCAIGQTLVILTGGIDLTVGSLITMGQIYGCLFVNGSDANLLFGLVVVVAVGIAFGLLNGVGISYLRISPLVMTLATSSLVNGVVLISINGAPNGVASPLLEKLGAGFFWGMPTIVWLWAAFTLGTVLFLSSTVVGRKIHHLGMSPTAAAFSGIRVNRLRTFVYAISGGVAALTGFLLAGNTSRAFLDSGKEYVMWSITAVVIGGTSMAGGKGGYLGTFAGTIIIIMLEGILTVIKMPESGRKIANGLILLIMIMIYFRDKKGRR